MNNEFETTFSPLEFKRVEILDGSWRQKMAKLSFDQVPLGTRTVTRGIQKNLRLVTTGVKDGELGGWWWGIATDSVDADPGYSLDEETRRLN